jgi:hypothetical protein
MTNSFWQCKPGTLQEESSTEPTHATQLDKILSRLKSYLREKQVAGEETGETPGTPTEESSSLRVGQGGGTEYTECWPCPLFDILLNKYYPAG